MTPVEEYYHKWIASKEATKYRNSPDYRYSEMMAFAEAWRKYNDRT